MAARPIPDKVIASASPRDASNRPATAEAHTTGLMSVPISAKPTQCSHHCQSDPLARPSEDKAATYAGTPMRAIRRAPSRSISTPMVGRANIVRIIEKVSPALNCVRDQPNSAVIAVMKMPLV